MPIINKALLARITAGTVATAVFIIGFEGNSNKVYIDPVGHHAVCVGHDSIAPDGTPLKLGQTYSDDVCSYLLGEDIAEAQKTLSDKVKVPLSDGEQLAYTDFVFNMGRGAFAKSTMLKKLNAGDHVGACKELPRWNKGIVKGKLVVLPGLVKRRAAELLACLG